MTVPHARTMAMLRRDALPFLSGFVAFVCQTLIFRSFFGAFESNEIGIALFFVTWLVWAALGALSGQRSRRGAAAYDALLWLYVPAFLVQQALCDHIHSLAHLPAYVSFPLARLVPLAIVVNAPLGWLTGWLFTRAALWRAADDAPTPVSRVYLLDALGGGLGGTATTIALAIGASEEQVFFAAFLLLGLAATVGAPRPRRAALHAGITALVALLWLGGADARWAALRDRTAWRRLGLALDSSHAFSTPRARYRVGLHAGECVVLAGQSVMETLPAEEPARALAAIHLAQHPQARRILIISPAGYALARAFLAAPAAVESVQWLHPDPDYPARLFARLPNELQPPPGLTAPARDARAFLKETGSSFDLIIVDMPDPTALAMNRYGTLEFLTLARSRLAPNGVLSLGFGGGENVLSESRARLGAIRQVTLSRLFRHLALLPGEHSRWFASDRPTATDDGRMLAMRWRRLEGADAFYSSAALATWFPADRIQFQKAAYERIRTRFGDDALLDTDLQPRAIGPALAHQWQLSGGRAGQPFARLFLLEPRPLRRGVLVALLGGALLRLAFCRGVMRRRPRGPETAATEMVAIGGAGLMGFTVALLYLFQSRFGTVFLHVGLLSALSMIGLFAGNVVVRRLLHNGEPRALAPIAIGLAAGLAALLALNAERIGPGGIAIALALGGWISGAWAPIAAVRMERRGWAEARAAAHLAMADALGGALGGLCIGLWLLPATGVRAGLWITAALFGLLIPAATRGATAETALGSAAREDAWRRALGYVGLWLVVTALASRAPWQPAHPPMPKDDRLAALAAEWAPGLPTQPDRLLLADGTPLPALRVGRDGQEGWIFTTDDLKIDAEGFGGPMVLGLWISPEGVLRAFRVLDHNETPSYFARTLDWQRRWIGRNLFESASADKSDAVSGATLTSRAIAFALRETGARLAALRRTAARPPRVDAGGIWLALFALAALIVRRRPTRLTRRLFLIATVLVLGLGWNAQFSLVQFQGWLTGAWPSLGLTLAAALALGVPLLVFFAGNVYCGWLCPFGTLQELLSEWLPARGLLDPDPRTWRRGRALKYAALTILALALIWNPEADPTRWDPLASVFMRAREMPPLRLAAIGFLALSVCFRRYWCRQWCPTGALLAWLGGGLGLFRRWRPVIWPACCDLGVGHRDELDCLACDRCRLPSRRDGAREAVPSGAAAWRRIAYLAAVLVGALIWWTAIRASPSAGAAGPTSPAASHLTPHGARAAPVERIHELQRRGRLADEEARYYERAK